MEQREKLIELLDQNCGYVEEQLAENLADYLLANGVVVSPCKVGNTVYEIITWHDCTNPYCYSCYDDEELSQIACEYHKIRTTIVERKFNYSMINKVGVSIFLTKEEAERVLEKRKGGDE